MFIGEQTASGRWMLVYSLVLEFEEASKKKGARWADGQRRNTQAYWLSKHGDTLGCTGKSLGKIVISNA